MKRLAIAALLVAAATGCSSTSNTSSTGATPAESRTSSPVSGVTSSTPSATTSNSPTPTATATNEAESLGEGMGAKIAFYAVAKTTGMDDSAKMDELAQGICSRIKAGKPDTVGQWMKDTFQLTGDIAAKVAIAAVTSDCPEYKSLVGS
jgi:hypothetical protein